MNNTGDTVPTTPTTTPSTTPSITPSVPPLAKRVPTVLERPTGDVVDEYHWLSNRDDPDTIAYLEAENAYTTAWFDRRRELVDTIFDEIRARTQETDESAPVPVDDWWYVTTTQQGQAYPAFHRGPSVDRAREQLLLDVNAEAANFDYFDLGAFDVTCDHTRVAWSADTDGSEHYTLRVRELATRTDLDDRLTDTSNAGTAWSNDGDYLFYVVADEQERPYRVMRHRMGSPQAADVEVYRDDDQRFFVGIELTRNRRSIMIHSGSKTSSEAWMLDANAPTQPAVLVAERADGVEYQVDHWGDRLVILTNLDADDFRVMTAPLDRPAVWTELVASTPGRRVTAIDPFASFLALHTWTHAQEQIVIVNRHGLATALHIDDEPHEIGLGANEQWDTLVVRLGHQSLTLPPRTIDVDVSGLDLSTAPPATTTGSAAAAIVSARPPITVVKQRPTPNTELANYTARRLWVSAPDGTHVPVDIVRHVDTPEDATAPCTVYGYGAYEISLAPWFSVARLSLLDRGHVWALVHPRGGGELGRAWYEGGKLLNKSNTFTDTLAACHALIDAQIAAPDRLAIRGGSAGGLLVGACVTTEPDLFASAVAEVPFVDIVTTMSDPSLPLTVTEWEEWGDPRTEPFATYIAGYSPYDRTVPQHYPSLLVTAGLNDPRVSYHEPAKWVARLRASAIDLGTDSSNPGDGAGPPQERPILLKTELGAGHGGPTGRYDAWRDEAQVLTFLHCTMVRE